MKWILIFMYFSDAATTIAMDSKESCQKAVINISESYGGHAMCVNQSTGDIVRKP